MILNFDTVEVYPLDLGHTGLLATALGNGTGSRTLSPNMARRTNGIQTQNVIHGKHVIRKNSFNLLKKLLRTVKKLL